MIYICENNLYEFGTPIKISCSNCEFHTRGDVVPGLQIDGMNVFMVKSAMQFARQHALEQGPIVIEAKTYRYHGFRYLQAIP